MLSIQSPLERQNMIDHTWSTITKDQGYESHRSIPVNPKELGWIPRIHADPQQSRMNPIEHLWTYLLRFTAPTHDIVLKTLLRILKLQWMSHIKIFKSRVLSCRTPSRSMEREQERENMKWAQLTTQWCNLQNFLRTCQVARSDQVDSSRRDVVRSDSDISMHIKS
jgi:hypothetical protein